MRTKYNSHENRKILREWLVTGLVSPHNVEDFNLDTKWWKDAWVGEVFYSSQSQSTNEFDGVNVTHTDIEQDQEIVAAPQDKHCCLSVAGRFCCVV